MFPFANPGRLVDGELTLQLRERREAVPAKGYVPEYRFGMVHTVRGDELGHIELRVGHTFDLVQYSGHLAYGVGQAHRGHRYAARGCRLLLPLARHHGLSELWITCNPDNVASKRTCELLGATLIEIVDLPAYLDMYREGERQKCRYRVEL